jgi:hypothetical protein
VEDTPLNATGAPTPAQIDPAVIANLEASPSGEIDIPRLVEHMKNGGVAADAAAEVQPAAPEAKIQFDVGEIVIVDGDIGDHRC